VAAGRAPLGGTSARADLRKREGRGRSAASPVTSADGRVELAM
jgi:hypothetical protein